jgi:hypothetical protein
MLLTIFSVAALGQGERSEGSKPVFGERRTLGAVCVLPNPAEPPTRVSPGGEYNPATLTVRIDKKEPVHWPHKQAVRIEDLLLNERHLVALRSDGKQIQSVGLRFSDHKNLDVCLSFDGYGGIYVGDEQNDRWCKWR